MKLIREIRWPVSGGRWRPRGAEPDPVIYETRQVGIREDAISTDECRDCWGTGREVKGLRSMNCEQGNHTTRCIGNTDPRECICFCHQDVVDKRAALVAKQDAPA
jgi:hypothetical protein